MTEDQGQSPCPGQLRTTRMEAFSDGAFAIATTLLVLEIAVPHAGYLIRIAAGPVWPIIAILGYLVVAVYLVLQSGSAALAESEPACPPPLRAATTGAGGGD